MDDLTLPVTASIRRVASAYLTGRESCTASWWPREHDFASWWAPKCCQCGAVGKYRPPLCEVCHSTNSPDRVPVLPLHIPAGLAIARLRLAEVLRSPVVDVHRVYVNGALADIHYSDSSGNIRLSMPIDRVPTSALETSEAAAIALALRHLDPELREAPNAPR
jgi:hypothetical protein